MLIARSIDVHYLSSKSHWKVVQGENHLEWPILGKLSGFYGCLLLDPWMSISYQVQAIGRWFKVRVFSV